MPITLAQLKKKTAEVLVEYQGDVAKVTYRVNAVTPLLQRKIAAAGSNHESLVAGISEVVVSWDVRESEDGPMIQPDSDAVSQLPTEFLDKCMAAILEDMRAGTDAKKA